MVIALISLLKNQQVKKKIALTGEITLRGKVLPIGGVKEKILAARRAGIKEVILPEKNKNDVIELPDIVKNEMELHYVEKIDQAVNIIFPPKNN